jgi:cytidine deaminase
LIHFNILLYKNALRAFLYNRILSKRRRRESATVSEIESSINMERETLLRLAREAALRAHCPYSHFHVGAALIADGKTYLGANVEISSYGLSLCAERSALAAAISDGAKTVTHIAVACIDAPPDAPLGARTPCGACRQWLADLAPDAVIYIDSFEQDLYLPDLLPHAFEL